jgi:molybdenum cofactor cytidylyltransferase
MLAAIILAGGESRRMGQPKALLEFRGRALLRNLLDVTIHPRIGCQRVVLGANVEEILARVPLPRDFVVVNSNWRDGQLSSLQAGLRALPPDTEGILLCPVDHALVSVDLIAALIAAFDSSKKDIAIPVFQRRRGHPVIFRNTLYGELLSAPAEVGARAVVHAHQNGICEVPTEEEGAILNLNDPETFRKAVERTR